MQYYARPSLAQTLATQLLGKQLFGDAPNGLFLAAPRRTGKSTFLQNDLKPALQAAGVVVIYVDLWANKQVDPGKLISDVIGQTILAHLGPVAKAAKAASLESVSVLGWLKIDTTKIGQPGGSTLFDALKALHEITKKKIALIIDEAQHSLTSESGDDAMAALKSARDQLNQPTGNINLMLVMSGSDRDKLLRLVNTNGAPFYGSEIHKMPELDRNFVLHCAQMIEQAQPALIPIDIDKLWEAFNLLGCRPQFFSNILGNLLNPLNPPDKRLEEAALDAAAARQVRDIAQMESIYLALKPLEQAIVWRLLDKGEFFRAYDVEALKFYQEKRGKKVTPQQVQNSLDALRALTPAMVWKSARGEYALDDTMMHQWYQKCVSAGTWPPSDPIFTVEDDAEVE